MDICRLRDHADGAAGVGPRHCRSVILKKKEGRFMPILFAVAGSALGCFAEGAILGASVYLVSRGVRNPLKNRK